jgi:hypothetical protein
MKFLKRLSCLMLLLLPVVSHAMTDAVFKKKINQLAFILSQDGMSRAAKGHRFKLTTDAAFPCKIKVEERQSEAGNNWVKSYSFTLEDMQTGSYFMARDKRRAIVYSARVRSATGQRREFSEKRINNFSLNISDAARQSEGRQLIDEVIRECRERNEF